MTHRIKIHGKVSDREFIADKWDKVATNHPVEKFSLVDVDDNLFIKTKDGIFKGKDHGRGSKSGESLITAGKKLEQIDDEIIKKLRARIEGDLKILDADDDDDDDDTPLFLPKIDELE